MSFSDLTFLFYFLPLFFAVYYILPFRFKNAALVLGSIAFYFIGAGARDTLLLSGVLLLHYALARAMAGKEVRTRKALLIIALAADLFCLVYFKYAAFILENLGKLTGTAFSLVQARSERRGERVTAEAIASRISQTCRPVYLGGRDRRRRG